MYSVPQGRTIIASVLPLANRAPNLHFRSRDSGARLAVRYQVFLKGYLLIILFTVIYYFIFYYYYYYYDLLVVIYIYLYIMIYSRFKA